MKVRLYYGDKVAYDGLFAEKRGPQFAGEIPGMEDTLRRISITLGVAALVDRHGTIIRGVAHPTGMRCGDLQSLYQMLSVARRRMLHAVRWISLPLAVLCLGAPLWSLVTDYQRYAGKSLIQARVLSSRISAPRSRGSAGSYEIEAGYHVGGRLVENRLEVTTYRLLKVGDTVGIFVDRKTGEVIDDGRFGSWEMVGWGMVGTVFFVLAGIRYAGKILAADHTRRARNVLGPS
jgi:hypothetical protein